MIKKRCLWVTDDPLYQAYHDKEWGRESRCSRYLFEMICLEGQQAGLSWLTVLKKRQVYRDVFYHFDPYQIVKLKKKDIDRFLDNPDLIRHRLKLESIVQNARAFIVCEREQGDFASWLWSLVGNRSTVNRWPDPSAVPTQTKDSHKLSKALKDKGFSFVGPTTCYAFMQAVGMVVDHCGGCYLTPTLKSKRG